MGGVPLDSHGSKVSFEGRKTCALRARFWLRCVRQLKENMASKNGSLVVPWLQKKMLQSLFLLFSGWWFQIFFIFTPTWGRFPF